MTMKKLTPAGLCLIVLSTFILAGCNVKRTAYEDTLSHEEKSDLGIGESKITGDGFFQIKGKKTSADDTNLLADIGGDVQVNRYLWTASLDIIAFMPLMQVDAVGGVILTEWHALPAEPNQRYKANVIITGTELRPDALQVRLFKQQDNGGGNWRDAAVDPKTEQQIHETILTRAREVRFFSLGLKDN